MRLLNKLSRILLCCVGILFLAFLAIVLIVPSINVAKTLSSLDVLIWLIGGIGTFFLIGTIQQYLKSKLGLNVAAAKPHPDDVPFEFPVFFEETDLIIRYRDAVGHLSDRRVTIKSAKTFRGNDGAFAFQDFHTYCHAAQAARTFRTDRIIHYADPETGELLSEADVNGLLTSRASLAKPLPKKRVRRKAT